VLLEDKIKEYNSVNYLGTIFSATLVIHLLTKAVFNLCVKVKMPLDKWSTIDLLCSLFNIVCFNVIGSVKPEQIMDPKQKENLDYYVIAVVIVGWVRFFGYFLMIRNISKLIMTLIRILYETFSFIFIVLSYLTIMSTIFTMLFQEPMDHKYGSMSLSYMYLFDVLIG